MREAEKITVIEAVNEARVTIESGLRMELIPEVGSNLCYSIESPANEADIAGFTGRIVRDLGRPRIVGYAKFGASKHVARIILAASRHDASIRSALNIKYNARNLEACKKAGLSMSSFSRENEPEGVSTMDWGTDQAIKRFGSVPDAIWDAGGHGKEPMIRILGKDPQDVLAKMIRMANQLEK